MKRPGLIGAIIAWVGVLFMSAAGFTTWWAVTEAPSPSAGTPALVIDRAYVKNPQVQPGQAVTIELQARRFHLCPSIIASFWLREDGQPWTRFPPITGGYTEVSTGGYVVDFNVPAPTENTLTGEKPIPGIYRYRSVNAPLCDGLQPTETPDTLRICLVVPGEPKPACAL